MGQQLVNTYLFNLTPSGGEASTNTTRIRGLLKLILVKPASTGTQYDIKIVNKDSIIIYQRLGETGGTSEQVELPLLGIYTITLSNATADEAFNLELLTNV